MKCIVDSGATKAAWMFIGHGKELAHDTSPGISPYYQSEAEIYATAREIRPELQALVTEIYFYGSGCDGETTSGKVRKALQKAFPNARTCAVHSDLLGAARALCQAQAGIACILGTGSNVCVYDGKDIQANIRGFGFILGDEGSGAALGKYLAIDYLYKRIPKDLSLHMEQALGMSEDAIMEAVYRKSFPSRYLASFSPFIHKHKGHPYFQQFLAQRFQHFLEVMVMPFAQESPFPVHIIGSIGYFFKEEIQPLAREMGLTLGNFAKSPMEGLIAFHQ